MKTMTALNSEIVDLVRGRDMLKVRALLYRVHKKNKFSALDCAELEAFILKLREAIEKGEL